MVSSAQRNFAFESVDAIDRLTTLPQVGTALARVVANFGFASVGIAELPPQGWNTTPKILTEITPPGFFDDFNQERMFLIDHIGAYSRVAAEPFRFEEVPYHSSRAKDDERYINFLRSYGLGKGMVVPVGSPGPFSACIWFSGKDPELHEDAIRVTQLIGLFAASKARAVLRPATASGASLTAREREVLTWSAHGKSSWEIGEILHISKRTVDEHTQAATRKLGAANKTQAVALALLRRMIDI